jgi:probable HAF family extracellular repeat protein
LAVNDNGQVIGWSHTFTGELHAFSWTEAEHMVDLTASGFGNSEAHTVIAAGGVVGDAVNSASLKTPSPGLSPVDA